MSPRLTRAERIARLNDRLRARVGVPVFEDQNAPPLGMVIMTRGFTALNPEEVIDGWSKVRNFGVFTRENDPYGEHDFGASTTERGTRLFWKIDYFADSSCRYGSEDPSDPNQSFRVLTIMLAEEY